VQPSITKSRSKGANVGVVIPRNYIRSALLGFPINWKHSRPYHLPDLQRQALGPYYIEWDPGTGVYGEDWTIAPYDAEGVILTAGIRKYHAVRIAQYGLHNYNIWLRTRSSNARVAFLSQARWLRDNQVERGGVSGCYVFDFGWPRFGAEAGWISAMAQGEAISLLLRAAEIEPDAGFADAAFVAANPYRYSLSEGGVVWRGNDGGQFFEEVAVSIPSHILNGHIYALWGLFDLLRAQPSQEFAQIADAGTKTLKSWLPLFDSGRWSYYMLLATPKGFRNLAQIKYQAFHVSQLRVMVAFTGDAYFGEVADRWESQMRRLTSRLHYYANSVIGLVPRLITHTDTIPSGARCIAGH
jgi:heparosan-N-sulfate-glucuronate 5-epimerase